MKYKVGDLVETEYGKGKISEIKEKFGITGLLKIKEDE